MTNNEAIAVLDNESKCVQKRANGECNGGTDCQTCELVLPDYMIISAYNKAIKLLDIDNIKDKISRKPTKSKQDNHFHCPNCGASRYINILSRYCSFCGQEIDWSKEKFE